MKQVLNRFPFFLVCAAAVAGIGLLSRVAEKALPEGQKVSSARRVTIIGVCAAIAALLHILDVPLLFLAPEFYRLDLSELPVLLAGFYLGPSASVACEGVKILLKLLLKGTTTAYVGDFANFIVGCFFVLPASLCYHARKSRHSAILGLSLGTICMTAFAAGLNAFYLLPVFAELYGLPLEQIIALGAKLHGGVQNVTTFVMLCVVPVNLVKGVVVSLLTMLLYKRVAKPLFGIHG